MLKPEFIKAVRNVKLSKVKKESVGGQNTKLMAIHVASFVNVFSKHMSLWCLCIYGPPFITRTLEVPVHVMHVNKVHVLKGGQWGCDTGLILNVAASPALTPTSTP